jgi:hypothetical protein
MAEEDIEKDVSLPKHYLPIIRHLAQEFAYASLNSTIGCQDLIKATLLAHASINKRKIVCPDDFQFVTSIRSYLSDPFNPLQEFILRYYTQGLSIPRICEALGKNPQYGTQVRRVVEKAQLRGVINSESPPKSVDIKRLKRNGEAIHG